jgi:hypothetical protein
LNAVSVFRANVFDDNEEDDGDIANCDGRYDLEFIEENYDLKRSKLNHNLYQTSSG